MEGKEFFLMAVLSQFSEVFSKIIYEMAYSAPE
jgi:hypothetical protein